MAWASDILQCDGVIYLDAQDRTIAAFNYTKATPSDKEVQQAIDGRDVIPHEDRDSYFAGYRGETMQGMNRYQLNAYQVGKRHREEVRNEH